MWDTLLESFPSIATLVKVLYGDPSSILLHEPGSGLTDILNSAGCKQGCSLGSFLFCLAIHSLLLQLQAEFSELLIIGYCDDINIVGKPDRVIEAYGRWAHLYGSLLQGQLRSDKCKVYSPSLANSASLLHSPGLPLDTKVSLPVSVYWVPPWDRRLSWPPSRPKPLLQLPTTLTP